MHTPSPQEKLVVCAVQRCGSTLLCDDLRNNGLGDPKEQFLNLIMNPDKFEGRDIIPGIIREGSSANGIFAVKIMANYAGKIEEYLAHRVGDTPDPANLVHLAGQFAGAVWILMRRRDVAAQAVSQLMSKATGINHAVRENAAGFVPGRSVVGISEDYNENVRINDRQIDAAIERIAAGYEVWEHFFKANAIQPLRFCYEDIISDFDHITRIRGELGLQVSSINTDRKLIKLANTNSEEIILRYKAKKELGSDV